MLLPAVTYHAEHIYLTAVVKYVRVCRENELDADAEHAIFLVAKP